MSLAKRLTVQVVDRGLIA